MKRKPFCLLRAWQNPSPMFGLRRQWDHPSKEWYMFGGYLAMREWTGRYPFLALRGWQTYGVSSSDGTGGA